VARDPRVDAFIAGAEPYARPILSHLRALVHREQPDAAETIKWGMPFFTLNGRNLCGMGAFKAHCAFIVEDAGSRGGEGMGHFGRIASMEDLPPEAVLAELLAARAAALRSGKARKAAPRTAKAEIAMPDDFGSALSLQARAFFDGLTPAQRREYLEWIVEAKRPETRARRVAQAAEWLAEGKKRNWKYESC
jgi:uncharacterized protein YdeI (YjbR/CyaY-like superfamily)